ncbi:MAG: ArsR/SmtB family transcription factor [Ruminiclostridium sp.]
MSNIIYEELNPFFETIGLLIAANQNDQSKKETLKELDELGFDGEKFYAKNLKIFDSYIHTFKKYSVLNKEAEFFFEDSDFSFHLLLISLLIGNKELIPVIDEINDAQINKEIIEICKSIFEIETSVEKAETLEDIVAFLDMTSIVKNEKWKIMCIMQSPKAYLKQLISIINDNIDAFEKAKKAVEPQLSKLLSQYRELTNSENKGQFYKLKTSFSETADIYPTLAFPLSQMILEETCYYGLLSSLVLKEEPRNQSKDEIIQGLKALSDKSKFEIIRSLKVSPKYNLEIAQQLGLTPATMSHHMNVLLTCGFVGINKEAGKVYYHLEEDSIRHFINMLEQTLL